MLDFRVRLLVPLLALAFAAPARAAAPSAYTVESLKGGSLTAGGGPVALGVALATGTALHLDKGQAVIALGAEGRLLLTGPADLTLGERAVSLSHGRLLSVLDRLASRFRVATPIAVAAVRGTHFFVEARDDGRTYLCLCRGVLEVSGADGAGPHRTLAAEHHAGYIFSLHGKVLDRNPWRMENHTDAEVDGLKP